MTTQCSALVGPPVIHYSPRRSKFHVYTGASSNNTCVDLRASLCIYLYHHRDSLSFVVAHKSVEQQSAAVWASFFYRAVLKIQITSLERHG